MGTASNESLAVLELRNNQINLTLGRYLIGSGQHCDIIIEDSTVEQRHAFLVVHQHCVKIVDLLTDSGTYVDDENICNGKFNDIFKSVSIKFGSVDAQLRLIEESDSGFLGFTSKDASDIIPMSPQECTTIRQNSEMGRSRIRSIKSSFQSEFRIPDPPLNSSRGDKPACDDVFLANVTDVNIRRNIEQMSEEDDYYIPETQEIFDKRPQSPKDDTNEGSFRISTQEFEEDCDTIKSSNVMDNTSLVIPLIRHSPILIPELKSESPTVSNSEPETRSEEPSAVVNVKTHDTESEISVLKWDESENNSAVPIDEDLDPLKAENQIKEGSVTPDLELNQVRSGSTTPDLFLASETNTSTHIDIEQHLFSPTQIFQPKKSTATKSDTSLNKAEVPLNVPSKNLYADTDPDLEVTQPFILRQKTNQSKRINSPDLLKNCDTVFARPLPKPALTTDATESEEYDNAEPTQPFKLKDKSKPSTSVQAAADDDDDFDEFAATQRFEFDKKKHRSISPAVELLSDEEISNEEFCLRETLEIGESDKNLEKTSKSLKNKGIPQKISKKVTEEDDLFADIQPTPCMDFIKLPNESVIDNVGKLFNKEINNQRRRVSLFADSPDEDDSVFIKETAAGKSKNNAEEKKNIVVWLKKDRKSDEALKQQTLFLGVQKDPQKKDSLSDQSSYSDVGRQRRGASKKRTKSSDKTIDKKAKQTKLSTNPNLEKHLEDVDDDKFEKTSGDATRKQAGRRRRKQNVDGKSKEIKEDKQEVPIKETRSKRTTTSKKESLKSTSEPTSKATQNLKVDDTKSEFGDYTTECRTNLCRRASKRIKSVPSHIRDDYFTESDLKTKMKKERLERIRKSTDIPKASRGETGTKKLKQDPKYCANPEKWSSDTSLDESEANKKYRTEALKCSAAKESFYTSTPSVRKSARQVKHRICFTRVDSSRYVDIMQKTAK